MIDLLRYKQVVCYGWKHSGIIQQKEQFGSFKRVMIFLDILYCFEHYRMWSNQYLAEEFYKLATNSRKEVGTRYLNTGIVRDAWQADFRENRKFLLKYTRRKYELAKYREKRNKAYQKRFNMGNHCLVEHNVEISRQHYLNGTISIGNNVLLAKNVFIDYSGFVEIGNDVQITDGVHILSHDHKHHHIAMTQFDVKDNDIQSTLKICDGVVIGTNSIILPSCHYIGKFARIGAGSVVSKDIPDYTVAVGTPARVIRKLV